MGRAFLLAPRVPEFDNHLDIVTVQPFGERGFYEIYDPPGRTPGDLLEPNHEQLSLAVKALASCTSIYYDSSDYKDDLKAFFLYIAAVLEIPEVIFVGGDAAYSRVKEAIPPGRPLCPPPAFSQPRIYLSGAITNNPHHHEDFDYYERYLSSEFPGAEIVNPISLDYPDAEIRLYPENAWMLIMRRCISALAGCDYICEIPCYVDSPEAAVEHQVAVGLGLSRYTPGLSAFRW